jgi:homoserine kinase type II
MSVYTTVSATELTHFLAEFSAGSLVSFEGISAGIENTNYFVNTECGHYVLTIFEHHSYEELDYFLKLMAWLSEAGVPTAHPLAGKDGGYLRPLCGKPATLVQRLRGKSVDQPTLEQCSVIGESLARLHLSGRGFNAHRTNDRDLDWMQSVRTRIDSLLDGKAKSFIDQHLAKQQTLAEINLPSGIIHADLFLDNALFDGDQLTGIIDLYYACNGVWLYDVAVTMNDWCRTPELTLDSHKVRAFLLGYASVRPWTSEEHIAWTMITQRAALRFYLSRLQDQLLPREGELTQIKDPCVFLNLLLWLEKNTPALVE